MTIQVSKDGHVYHVQIVTDGEPPEHDGTYETSGKAEQRAEVLAQLLSCDWETNY